jgi:hypothetical protein
MSNLLPERNQRMERRLEDTQLATPLAGGDIRVIAAAISSGRIGEPQPLRTLIVLTVRPSLNSTW